MEQKPIEIQIQDKIDKAVELFNKKEELACDELCEEIFEMINKTYGRFRHNVGVGLFHKVHDGVVKLEYIKPSMRLYLMKMKSESYWEYIHDKGWSTGVRLNDVIEYFHSSLALHYFEHLEKVPDELRVSKHENTKSNRRND